MRLLILILALFVMISAPTIAQSPQEGAWKAGDANMTITKQGDVYLVEIICPGCMGPVAGAFVGPLKGNILMINSAFGVIVYNSDGSISYVGERWRRVR